jgi:TIGR03009 family protein
MRCAALVLAALLVAVTASAQPPAVPGQPPIPPPAPPVAQADPKLDAHLAQWEKKMGGVSNFRTVINLTRTEDTFKKKTNFTGVVLCMKPNFAILRLDNANDPKKIDYEAYQCDGKNLYVFDGPKKTVTRVKLQQNQGVDNVMLDFLGGMKAADVKRRFDIKLFQEDANYVYMDIKPLQPADQREFKQIRMALYKDTPATTKWAYLPAQVFLLKPSGDTEEWKFSETQIGIEGVKPELFAFTKAPAGFELKDAPATPVGGAPVPPGGLLPAGGAVRPNK